LELSRLRKAGFFAKEATTMGAWYWSNDDRVAITTVCKGAEVYMELSYTYTHPITDATEEVLQRIEVVTVPSNLGVGTVLYFLCPATLRPCRILYRAYHARIFKSRNAFSYRLYYPSQLSGKLSRWDEQYWQAERHLEGMKQPRGTGKYRGKPTKRAQRWERLYAELERTDELRWSLAAWPKGLQGAFSDLR
jgi:hypothetical protein